MLVKGENSSVLIEFLRRSLWALLLIIFCSLLIQGLPIIVALSAYLLSFLFVASNFLVIQRLRGADNAKFYWQFFLSLGLRFLLVLVALVVILKAIKIHQIYFTVSFIISYIFHSVIEIILINKILETDN